MRLPAVSSVPFILAVVLGSLALATPVLSAAEVVKSAAPKIAVLRLEEVLRQSKTYLAGMEVWKKQQAEAQAALGAIDEQLKRLDGQLQVINKDSDNFAKYQEEFETLKLRKKISYEQAKIALERRQVILVKDAYKQLRGSLTTFAQERGIMLVHLAPDPLLGAPTFNEIQLELGLKTVLYYDPSLDITDSFVQYLNAADGAPGQPTVQPTVQPADRPAVAPTPAITP